MKRRRQRRHKRIAHTRYDFREVREGDAHAGCIWEYACESPLLQNASRVDLELCRRTETSFLAAMLAMDANTFLRVPWTEKAAQIRTEFPDFADKPISVAYPIAPRLYPPQYPITVVTGAGAPQEPNFVIVKIDVRYTKKEIQDALAKILDRVTKRMPLPYLSGRETDWRGRLDWLGSYRLRRAGYAFHEIAQLQKERGRRGSLETIERSLKKEVKHVPGIFMKLFPYHVLPKQLGGTGKVSEPLGYYSALFSQKKISLRRKCTRWRAAQSFSFLLEKGCAVFLFS